MQPPRKRLRTSDFVAEYVEDVDKNRPNANPTIHTFHESLTSTHIKKLTDALKELITAEWQQEKAQKRYVTRKTERDQAALLFKDFRPTAEHREKVLALADEALRQSNARLKERREKLDDVIACLFSTLTLASTVSAERLAGLESELKQRDRLLCERNQEIEQLKVRQNEHAALLANLQAQNEAHGELIKQLKATDDGLKSDLDESKINHFSVKDMAKACQDDLRKLQHNFSSSTDQIGNLKNICESVQAFHDANRTRCEDHVDRLQSEMQHMQYRMNTQCTDLEKELEGLRRLEKSFDADKGATLLRDKEIAEFIRVSVQDATATRQEIDRWKSRVTELECSSYSAQAFNGFQEEFNVFKAEIQKLPSGIEIDFFRQGFKDEIADIHYTLDRSCLWREDVQSTVQAMGRTQAMTGLNSTELRRKNGINFDQIHTRLDTLSEEQQQLNTQMAVVHSHAKEIDQSQTQETSSKRNLPNPSIHPATIPADRNEQFDAFKQHLSALQIAIQTLQGRWDNLDTSAMVQRMLSTIIPTFTDDIKRIKDRLGPLSGIEVLWANMEKESKEHREKVSTLCDRYKELTIAVAKLQLQVQR